MPLSPKDSLQRVHEAAECRTQSELVAFLGIGQSSISDAKRRGTLPAEWLITLLLKKHINPEWILTGQGARHLVPAEDAPLTVVPSLAQYSLEDLLREAFRRVSAQ